jgi:hypothetical protein
MPLSSILDMIPRILCPFTVVEEAKIEEEQPEEVQPD